MDPSPERPGATGGEGRSQVTRTDFVQLGRQFGFRGEDASRAFTVLVRHATYLGLELGCTNPPCRGRYCVGKHAVAVDQLSQVGRNVLSDVAGVRTTRWRVFEQILDHLEAGQGA